MDTYAPATDVDSVRERIKLAWSNYEFCNECGMPMVIETHGSRLWIECRSLRSLGGLRLFLSACMHDRYAIEGFDEAADQAAA